MSQFYGTLSGQAGTATRRGSKNSGLRTIAASWEGAVQVDLYERDGKDYARVSLVPWHGHGVTRELFNGPVDGTASQARAA